MAGFAKTALNTLSRRSSAGPTKVNNMHIRSPKSIAGVSAAILGTALALMHNVSAATVELPAGSADGLTAAIAAA